MGRRGNPAGRRAGLAQPGGGACAQEEDEEKAEEEVEEAEVTDTSCRCLHERGKQRSKGSLARRGDPHAPVCVCVCGCVEGGEPGVAAGTPKR